MGLDFYVSSRPNDDRPENDPTLVFDARRANDPSPEVEQRLQSIYRSEAKQIEERITRYEERRNAPRPKLRPLTRIRYCFGFGIGLVFTLVFRPKRFFKKLMAGPFAIDPLEEPDLEVPTFEDWRADLIAQDPIPIVIAYGPNCPPDAISFYQPVGDPYGFGAKFVQCHRNDVADLWEIKNNCYMGSFIMNEYFLDEPTPSGQLPDVLREPTVGEMANFYEIMANDSAVAFPDLAATADQYHNLKTTFYRGPRDNPDRAQIKSRLDELEEMRFELDPENAAHRIASVEDLLAIRDAARFFRFWEGRGYPITPSF